MNHYVLVCDETANKKYCKSNEKIVHRYYLELKKNSNGHVTAYRRSLYTRDIDYNETIWFREFYCNLYKTKKAALADKKQMKETWPDLNLKVIKMTDEEITKESIESLVRD